MALTRHPGRLTVELPQPVDPSVRGCPAPVEPFSGAVRSRLQVVASTLGVAVAAACLLATEGLADTPPSPDASTQVQPDAVPGAAQPQSSARVGPSPEVAGYVTPASPSPSAAAPRSPARPTSARPAAASSKRAGRSGPARAGRRRESGRSGASAAQATHGNVHHVRSAPPSRTRSPLFRDPLSGFRDVAATTASHGGSSGSPFAAIALLLVVVAGGSLLRLSGGLGRGRPV